jgi:hypothetical protein
LQSRDFSKKKEISLEAQENKALKKEYYFFLSKAEKFIVAMKLKKTRPRRPLSVAAPILDY